MPPPKKFTDEQLRQYLKMDFSQVEIARLFNVSREAVAQRVGKLEKAAAVREPKVVSAAVASVWDTRAALEENFKGCLALLNDEDVDSIRVRTELRNHIKLGMDVIQTLYAVEETKAFQEEVLTILDECEPGTRQRILERLQQRRTLRAAFTSSDRQTL